MKQEIRARIDQIRQGIVPEGYKKTESGIIPNEWRVGQVSKCIEEYKFFSNDISHIPVYSSSRKGLVPQSDYYNQREAVETNLGYKVVPQGYVTYRHMSDDDVFHFNINKTGENVLVSSEYPVFTSSDNCDLSFLISVLNNTARFRYFCKMQKLGGTRTRLYLDNLKRYALALPPFDEQKKIAEILATQDKAIELQGRKIEELKRFKKGCLEKMFPRKGQKVPEKRFPGFTGDWEQRKVGDFTNVLSASRVHKNEWKSTGVPFFRSSDVVSAFKGNDNERAFISMDLYEELCRSSGKLEQDDILITGGGSIGIPYIVPNNKPLYSKDTDLIWIKKSSLHDSKYLFTYFRSPGFREYICSISHVGTIAHYTIEQVKDTPVLFPALAEQRIIGSFFTNLDHLITLHQRKLEEMKRQKKALMQTLLTGIVRVKA